MSTNNVIVSETNYAVTVDESNNLTVEIALPSVGPSGPVGYTGSAGADGIIGRDGYVGSMGYTGSKGADGYIGADGAQGYTGSKGDTGYVGSKGNDGSVGYTGSAGANGSAGQVGFTGSAGIQGVKGNDGSNGFTGSVGFTGSAGANGAAGATGDVGFTGSAGQAGADGVQGFTGSAGVNGTNGADGAQGYTGSKGADGTIGYNGSIGYTGSAGIQGYTGSRGEDGIIGYNGSIGYTGSAGIDSTIPGPQGIQGPIGYTGSSGTGGGGSSVTVSETPPATPANGDMWWNSADGQLKVRYVDADSSQWVDAINGIVGPTGYVGSQGIQGYTGSQGDIGYTGSQGDLGYVGSQGIQGYTGSQGIQGVQGLQGYTGSQGEIGYTGSASTVIGYTGSKGQDGAVVLDNLNDVIIAAPTAAQILGYNGSMWINTAAPQGAPGYLYSGTVTAQPTGTGEDTLVIGDGATGGSGQQNVIIGCGAGAYGNPNSIVTGAVAIGATTQARAYAVAIGNNATGLNTASTSFVAVGPESMAQTSSIAIGPFAKCAGSEAIRIGYTGSASGTNAISIGTRTQATGLSALAIGPSLVVDGNRAVGIGTDGGAGYGGDRSISINTTSGGVTAANSVNISASTTGCYTNHTQTVAIGGCVNTDFVGSTGFGNGSFTNGRGCAQAVQTTLLYETTTATPTVLGVGQGTLASTPAGRITLANNATYICDFAIVARSTSSTGNAAWNIRCCATQDAAANTTAVIGTPIVEVVGADSGAAAWVVAVSANTTTGSVDITVTGEAGKTIRWVATAYITKVGA